MTALWVAIGIGSLLVLTGAAVLVCRMVVATALILRLLSGFAEDESPQEAAGARLLTRPAREDAPARVSLHAHAAGAAARR